MKFKKASDQTKEVIVEALNEQGRLGIGPGRYFPNAFFDDYEIKRLHVIKIIDESKAREQFQQATYVNMD